MPRNNKTANLKISQALELLDEAAVDKKEEIRELLDDGFDQFKEAVSDVGPGLRDSIQSSKEKVRYLADRAKDKTVEKTKEVSHAIDDNVRSNPWSYLGAAAGSGLVLGFLLGRKS